MVNFYNEFNNANDSSRSDIFQQVQHDGKLWKIMKIVFMLIGVIGVIGFLYMSYEYFRMQKTEEPIQIFAELSIVDGKLVRNSRSVQQEHLQDNITFSSIDDVDKTTVGELDIEVENITAMYEYNKRTHPVRLSNNLTSYELQLEFLGTLLFGNLSGVLVGEMKSIQQKIIGEYSTLLDNMNYLENGKLLIILTSKSSVENWLHYFKTVSAVKIIEYDDNIKNNILLNNCTRDTKCDVINNTQVIIMNYEDMKNADKNTSLFEILKVEFVVYDLNDIHETDENLNSTYLTLIQLPNVKNKIILLNTFDDHQMYLYKYIYMALWSSVYKKNSFIYEKYIEDCQRKCFTEKFDKLNQSLWCTKIDVQQAEKEMEILKTFTFKTDPIIYQQNYPSHDEKAVYCKLSPRQQQYQQALEYSIENDINTEDFNISKAIKTIKKLRALANHVLLTRNYWDDELVDYAIYLIDVYNMLKHSRTKQLKLVDYSSLSDIEINRLFTPYNYLESLIIRNDTILDGSGKFIKLNEILPGLKLRRHRVAMFSERSNIYLIERYLLLKGYRFIRVSNETSIDKQMATVDKFNKDLSIFIIIVPFVDVCREFTLNLSTVDTAIMFSVTFHKNYLKTINECYHFGEKKPIKVERLISENTIEQYIYETKPKDLQDFYKKIFSTVG